MAINDPLLNSYKRRLTNIPCTMMYSILSFFHYHVTSILYDFYLSSTKIRENTAPPETSIFTAVLGRVLKSSWGIFYCLRPLAESEMRFS